ncbi:MAG: ribonuclease H-like domain-containing protein [bacterium]|nr:ribonuclease H-like domain-containing protein [bacterium]
MPKLIFDIETIGENFDELDETTQDALSWWIKKESSGEEDYKVALEELKNGLGFSPLTGQIVAIGVLDREKDKGAVYYQNPDNPEEELEENGIKFKALSEKDMLEKFWQGAEHYDEFVSFNGRSFDVPFLMVRSAILGIRPSVDLMSNRYLSSQRFGVKHIDLLDQLSFYGAVRRKGNLHLWCRAFSIKSPKDDGVTGEDVGKLFRENKFLDIAKYNVGDLRATKALYDYWEKHLRF